MKQTVRASLEIYPTLLENIENDFSGFSEHKEDDVSYSYRNLYLHVSGALDTLLDIDDALSSNDDAHKNLLIRSAREELHLILKIAKYRHDNRIEELRQIDEMNTPEWLKEEKKKTIRDYREERDKAQNITFKASKVSFITGLVLGFIIGAIISLLVFKW